MTRESLIESRPLSKAPLWKLENRLRRLDSYRKTDDVLVPVSITLHEELEYDVIEYELAIRRKENEISNK